MKKSKQRKTTLPPRGWTAAELRLFKKLYPMSHNSDLAERFDRAVDTIRKKAIKLGIKKDWAGGYRVHQPPQNENLWTPDEVKQLQAMYLHFTNEQIAAKLNRSRMAVQAKIRKLKLCKEFRNNGKTRRPVQARWSDQEIETLKELYPVKTKAQIAEEMRRSFRAVGAMITKLRLSGEKPSVAWTAEEDEFLEKHIFTWPVEKIAEKLGRGCRAVQGRAWRKRLLKQTGWTKEEIQQLRHLLPNHSRQEIAEKLGRTVYSVAKKQKRLGLQKRKRITAKDIAILKKFFPIEPNEVVAQRLGVKPPTVAAKARELGLHKSVYAKYRTRP